MHALIPLETRIIPKMSSKTVCESIHIKTHSEKFLYNWNITLNHWFICKVNNRCSFCKCLWLNCMICLPIFCAFLSFITTLLDVASRLTIITSYRADLFYIAMLCMFVLCCGVYIKKPTFLKPDGISCTLGERDIYDIYADTFVNSGLWLSKVRKNVFRNSQSNTIIAVTSCVWRHRTISCPD